MSNPLSFSRFLLAVFFVAQLFPPSFGDVGTATHYRPPYIPTACAGSALSQFPTDNLFGAAGEGIWENGAACGRQYLVRCLSAAVPRTCLSDQIIQITIVDRAITSVSKPASADTTMVLSTTAFNSIAQGSPSFVNIEFLEV